MVSIQNIRGSDGTGAAGRATVTGTRAAANPTIIVDALTNWPATFIGATGSLNLSTGNINPATLQVFFGHESSGTIVIDSFAPGYTDIGNSIGDVVILKPTGAWADEIANVLGVSLEDNGTIKSTVIDDILNTGRTADDLRLKPRATTTASTATLTPDIDSYNVYYVTAQAVALTIANPTGTKHSGDVIIIHIKDNGTTRAITYGTDYVNISGLDTITTTTVNKWQTLGIQWNATASKWHVISITTEA